MRTTFLTLLVVAVIGVYVPSALACSCMEPPPPQEAMEQSDAVFSGRVAKVELRDNVKHVTVDVARRWKGVDATQVEVVTALDGAMCGYNFKEGDEYLIYAANTNGTFRTGICTRTKRLDQAEEDLQALGEGEAPTTQPAGDGD